MGTSLHINCTPAGGFGAPAIPTFGASSYRFGASSATPYSNFTITCSDGSSNCRFVVSFDSHPGPSMQQTPASVFGNFGSPQPQPHAFGFPSFGQPQPAFGNQPYGCPTLSFGAQLAPSFGNTATSLFGASTPAFGVASTPTFGVSVMPAFGAVSNPAFGMSTPTINITCMFPASGGGSTIGQVAPAFSASSTPTLGIAPPAIPSGVSSGSSFTFGGGEQQVGSRVKPYTVTNDTDSGVGIWAQAAKFMSISAMPAYIDKEVEELRWADYQAGDRGGSILASPQPASGDIFGKPTTEDKIGNATSVWGQPPSPQPVGGNIFGEQPPTTSNLFCGSPSTVLHESRVLPPFSFSLSPSQPQTKFEFSPFWSGTCGQAVNPVPACQHPASGGFFVQPQEQQQQVSPTPKVFDNAIGIVEQGAGPQTTGGVFGRPQQEPQIPSILCPIETVTTTAGYVANTLPAESLSGLSEQQQNMPSTPSSSEAATGTVGQDANSLSASKPLGSGPTQEQQQEMAAVSSPSGPATGSIWKTISLQAAGGGLSGRPTQQEEPLPSTSNLFGGSLRPATQQQQQQHLPSTPICFGDLGLFGRSPQETPTSSNTFGVASASVGQTPNTVSASPQTGVGGLFGRPQQQQRTPFTTSSTGVATSSVDQGTNAISASPQPGVGGLFGRPQQQQQTPSTTSSIGVATSSVGQGTNVISASPQPSVGGLFGRPQQQETPSTTGSTGVATASVGQATNVLSASPQVTPKGLFERVLQQHLQTPSVSSSTGVATTTLVRAVNSLPAGERAQEQQPKTPSTPNSSRPGTGTIWHTTGPQPATGGFFGRPQHQQQSPDTSSSIGLSDGSFGQTIHPPLVVAGLSRGQTPATSGSSGVSFGTAGLTSSPQPTLGNLFELPREQ